MLIRFALRCVLDFGPRTLDFDSPAPDGSCVSCRLVVIYRNVLRCGALPILSVSLTTCCSVLRRQPSSSSSLSTLMSAAATQLLSPLALLVSVLCKKPLIRADVHGEGSPDVEENTYQVKFLYKSNNEKVHEL